MFLALAVYRLCNLSVSQDPNSEVRRVIELLRSRLLRVINKKLDTQHVDDVLIQSICLTMIVDDYLGYVEFGRAHLSGLKTMTALRGGMNVVGSSEPALSENLPHIVMTVLSTVTLNVDTNLQRNSSNAPLSSNSNASGPVSNRAFRQLPDGFQRLTNARYLSPAMVDILESFMSWLNALDPATSSSARSWRADTPRGLSDLEKCIMLALICLADDMSGMAGKSYLHGARKFLTCHRSPFNPSLPETSPKTRNDHVSRTSLV